MGSDRLFRKPHPPFCTCVDCNNKRLNQSSNVTRTPIWANAKYTSSTNPPTPISKSTEVRPINSGAEYGEQGNSMLGYYIVAVVLLLAVVIGGVLFSRRSSNTQIVIPPQIATTLPLFTRPDTAIPIWHYVICYSFSCLMFIPIE